MIVDIQRQGKKTLIVFKEKDFTNYNDILGIACGVAAGNYCFEAGSLLSPDFVQFIENIKLRIKYGILIRHDNHGKPLVRWGRLQGNVLTSSQM